jgi:hypothetical protein
MKVKYLENNKKSFLIGSILLTFFILIFIAAIFLIYQYASVNVYATLLLVIILIAGVVLALFVAQVILILHIYNRNKIPQKLIKIVKTGLNFLFPVLDFIVKRIGSKQDAVKRFYIQVNNILVTLQDKRYSPKEILLLLPHCLQNAECTLRITKDIYLCKQCGKCCIGGVLSIVKENDIYAAVVNGGTAARNIVNKRRPQMILSVACERDLISGIADVSEIPAIGIVNERPNGPCYNTTVSTELIKNELNNILKK